MPRYGAKTYGRGVRKEGNDGFDDLWNKTRDSKKPATRLSPNKRQSSNVPQSTRLTRSSPIKLSRMSNSESSRPTRQNTVIGQEVMMGVTSPKRRRRASGADDPFSFSSDDDKSPAKKQRVVDKNPGSNSVSSRQTRTSLQFDNGVENKNSTRAASRGATSTRSSAKDKTAAGQTLITQFAGNARNNDAASKRNSAASSERKDNIDDEIDSVGSPNGSDASSCQSASVGGKRSSRRDDNKLSVIEERQSAKAASSQEMSPDSASVQQSLQSSGQSSAMSQRTNELDSAWDFPVNDDSDDEVIIISSTSGRGTSWGSSQSSGSGRGGSQPQGSGQPSGSAPTSQASVAAKPALRTSKSLPPAKPSNTVFDEFDFSDEEVPDAPPMKKAKSAGGVEATKKLLSSPSKKSPAKAKYNARSWHKPDALDEDEFNSSPSESGQKPLPAKPAVFRNEGSKGRPSTGLTKQTIYPNKPNHSMVTSLKCKRDEKKLYTVVRHVKGASDCQESGESQQFADDIEYLLDGLKDTENTGTRCLSTMGFVEKCSMPSFRMHMRAHGTISKVFGTLQDAAQDPKLGLCTAGLMYMLSRDRLNMDLDRESLMLLVKLLSKDTGHRIHQLEAGQQAEYKKVQDKLWSIFSDLPKASNTTQDIECPDLSNGYLAMESLLSLTGRRAGEWFKEELRLTGGLEHIANTVISAALSLSPVTGRMEGENLVLFKTMNRCLRVLENVTFQNKENQQYLLELRACGLVKAIGKVLRMCENQLEMCGEPVAPVFKKLDSGSLHSILHQGLLATLRLLLNISHDNDWGSMKVGEQDGLMATALQCVLQMPQFICKDQRFDVLVLSLGLLINLVEHSPANTRKLISMRTMPSFDSQSMSQSQSNSHSQSQTNSESQSQSNSESQSQSNSESESQSNSEAQSQSNLESQSQSNSESQSNSNSEPQLQSQSQDSVVSTNSSCVPVTSLEALVQMFLQRQRAAIKAESQSEEEMMKEEPEEWSVAHSDPLDWISFDQDVGKGQNGPQPTEEEMKASVRKALHSAGKHMEDCIVASYTALLLGCLLRENNLNVASVRDCLPDGDFTCMVDMLKKFLSFIELTQAAGNSGSKSISKVIEVLECF